MQRIAYLTVLLVFMILQTALALTQEDVPAIYANIVIADGQPVVVAPNGTFKLDPHQATPDYTLQMLHGKPMATDTGFAFSFTDASASETLAGGTLFYSLWNPEESRYPMPHYRFSTPIDNQGNAEVKMSELTGRYDLSGWEASGTGILYYRVSNAKGAIVYEGKFFFTANPFAVGT